MSTPGLLRFLLGGEHAILSWPWNADLVQGRRANTGRVKLEEQGVWGAFCLQFSFWGRRAGKRLEAVYCLFCNVNSEEGERAGSKNWTVNSPLSVACTACRHAKHWVDFAWDKPGPRFDPSPDIFGTGWKHLLGMCENISGIEGRRLSLGVKINIQGKEGSNEVKGLIRYELTNFIYLLVLSLVSCVHPQSSQHTACPSCSCGQGLKGGHWFMQTNKDKANKIK